MLWHNRKHVPDRGVMASLSFQDLCKCGDSGDSFGHVLLQDDRVAEVQLMSQTELFFFPT